MTGGVAGVLLLKAGTIGSAGSFGYGTTYGPLILFTGLSSAIGGWVLLWKWNRSLQNVMRRGMATFRSLTRGLRTKTNENSFVGPHHTQVDLK